MHIKRRFSTEVPVDWLATTTRRHPTRPVPCFRFNVSQAGKAIAQVKGEIFREAIRYSGAGIPGEIRARCGAGGYCAALAFSSWPECGGFVLCLGIDKRHAKAGAQVWRKGRSRMEIKI